jgi:hypothetical protein
MTEIPISGNTWKLAQAILTGLQYTALTLRERHGYSWNMVAITMNSTRPTAKEHHRAATKNLLDAIEAAGGIEEAVAAHTDQEKPCESSSSSSPNSTSSSPASANQPESKTPEPSGDSSSTFDTANPEGSTSSSSETKPSSTLTSPPSASSPEKTRTTLPTDTSPIAQAQEER